MIKTADSKHFHPYKNTTIKEPDNVVFTFNPKSNIVSKESPVNEVNTHELVVDDLINSTSRLYADIFKKISIKSSLFTGCCINPDTINLFNLNINKTINSAEIALSNIDVDPYVRMSIIYHINTIKNAHNDLKNKISPLGVPINAVSYSAPRDDLISSTAEMEILTKRANGILKYITSI